MRRAFTFIEMLVVLVILAALTVVAVQSLEPVAQQSRAAATTRSLEDLKSALLTVDHTGGHAVVGGFVADMGRLPDLSSPQAFYNDLALGAGLPLAQNYNVTSGTGSATAVITCGWRGPYLRTAVTSTQFVDGWGKPLSVVVEDGSYDALSDRILIASTGNPATSIGAAGQTLSVANFSASQLSVRMYGLDAAGHRMALTGTGSAVLHGGIDSLSGGMLTTTGSVSSSGTDLLCNFVAQPPVLLAGPRVVAVDYTPASGEVMTTYPQALTLTLLPGSSQNIDVLIARESTTSTP